MQSEKNDFCYVAGIQRCLSVWIVVVVIVRLYFVSKIIDTVENNTIYFPRHHPWSVHCSLPIFFIQ